VLIQKTKKSRGAEDGNTHVFAQIEQIVVRRNEVIDAFLGGGGEDVCIIGIAVERG